MSKRKWYQVSELQSFCQACSRGVYEWYMRLAYSILSNMAARASLHQRQTSLADALSYSSTPVHLAAVKDTRPPHPTKPRLHTDEHICISISAINAASAVSLITDCRMRSG